MMRKEDGKRDPYSPYEENGSHIREGSNYKERRSSSRLNANGNE